MHQRQRADLQDVDDAEVADAVLGWRYGVLAPHGERSGRHVEAQLHAREAQLVRKLICCRLCIRHRPAAVAASVTLPHQHSRLVTIAVIDGFGLACNGSKMNHLFRGSSSYLCHSNLAD